MVEFKILDQQHDWTYTADGGRDGQWTITFETPSGWRSQVVVPDSAYSPDIVGPVIADYVKRIEDVGGLTGA